MLASFALAVSQAVWADTADDAYKVGAEYLKGRRYQKSLEYLDRAIGLNPQFADAYVDRGRAYMRLKSYAKAVSDFGKALELSPGSARALSERGWALNTLDEFEKAVTDFTKAISIEPGNAQAYVGRARAYKGINKCDKAIEDYERALELNPSGRELIEKSKADAYLRAGALEKARGLFAELFKSYPDNAFAQIDQINILYRLKEYGRVVELSTRAMDKPPEYAWYFHCARAAAFGKSGRMESALADCRDAIRSPETAGAKQFATRGDTYFDLGEYGRAIEDYSTAIRRRLQFKEAFASRAKAYLADRRPSEAADDCDKALAIEWKNGKQLDAQIYKTRGACQMQLGSPAGALSDFDLSLQMYKYDPDVYALRAQAHRKLGNVKMADSDLQQALEFGYSDRSADDHN